MLLLLVDPKKDLCDAWEKAFRDLPNVEIIQGRFESLPEFDCIITAANSFGLMDGGVDLAIVNFFGQTVMQTVQEAILQDYLGEQPIGTCLIVNTNHPRHPFVAHTPTMRVPMPIAHTDQVYLAMWAALLAVHRHNQTAARTIHRLACPGLGTTTGRMPYSEAAEQMAMAYQNFLNPPQSLNWSVVQQRPKPFKPYQVGLEYWHSLRELSNL